MTMSDRIAVMRAGHIEQLGAPEDLYERPQTAFVAGFLGVSNLLDGVVTGREGDRVAVKLMDGSIVRAPADSLNGETEIRVGVRPEKLRLEAMQDPGETGEPLDENTIEGTILDASYIGVSTQYIVATSLGHNITVYAQNLETSGAREALAGGQRVRLSWQPRHTFVISGPHAHVAGDPHSAEGEQADV